MQKLLATTAVLTACNGVGYEVVDMMPPPAQCDGLDDVFEVEASWQELDGEPIDVATAVLHLCSRLNAFVTEQTILVNGGAVLGG